MINNNHQNILGGMKMKVNTKKNEKTLFTGNRYQKASNNINNFDDVIAMIKKSNPNANTEDLIHIIESQINNIGDTGVIVVPSDPHDPKLMQSDIVRLTADDVLMLKGLLKTTSPTDEILVSKDTLMKLADFWKNPKENNPEIGEHIPADIFWSNTIPIKDCIIKNPEYEHLRLKSGEESIVYCRVVIFMDPVTAKGHVCGAVIIHYSNGTEYFTTFGLSDEENTEVLNKLIISKAVGILSTDPSQKISFYKNDYFFNMHSENLFMTLFSYLNAWYGLQVALLNPQIKLVFTENSTKGTYEIPSKKKLKKGEKRPAPKIKYIKRYTITEAVFNDAIKRSYVHTKMSWYVTGHWRNQAVKDGHKRIFIQGYWKGVARDSKTADIREREVVIPAPASQAPTQDDSWIDSLNKKYHI